MSEKKPESEEKREVPNILNFMSVCGSRPPEKEKKETEEESK
jgi:hypothetical protein